MHRACGEFGSQGSQQPREMVSWKCARLALFARTRTCTQLEPSLRLGIICKSTTVGLSTTQFVYMYINCHVCTHCNTVHMQGCGLSQCPWQLHWPTHTHSHHAGWHHGELLSRDIASHLFSLNFVLLKQFADLRYTVAGKHEKYQPENFNIVTYDKQHSPYFSFTTHLQAGRVCH